MAYQLSFKPYGEHAILVEWPKLISEDILKDVLRFKTNIEYSDVANVSEVRSAYNSLLLVYSHFKRGFQDEVDLLKKIYNSNTISSASKPKLWKIPVCYDSHFGIDLEAISETKKLSVIDIIKFHSEAIYTVYFIGFLPGFLYLGGLDDRIMMPRKSTPRLKIEQGTVAIGGNQTGVYPSASPGGWNIIGNSPINFFNINKEEPCFAKAGDQIQFYPITLKEHTDIKTLVDAQVYQLESEVVDG
ncbi:5-oxoprolinase subunit PxpB [Flavobacteriaceae bacterium SZ-1-7]|uniref:5-oxoprolinase subunit PxpB n=1 Tax=Tamlana sedimenti TaxID=3134126 RepID=UPI00312268CF